MVVMMVVMMAFGGAALMHGDHRDGNNHLKTEHPQEHSYAGPQHMHDSDAEKEQPDNQEMK